MHAGRGPCASGCHDLTVVGVFRRTAGGRHAGDDKRNRPARHHTANHGGVAKQAANPNIEFITLPRYDPVVVF